MNIFHIIRDFRKWRKEQYEKAYNKVLDNESNSIFIRNLPNYETNTYAYRKGLKYGIEHRKEILKKIKI